MTREEIVKNLKYTMEKHKNDTVNTFDTNISAMCKDILDYLEQEPKQRTEKCEEEKVPCEDAISIKYKEMSFGYVSDLVDYLNNNDVLPQNIISIVPEGEYAVRLIYLDD